VHVIIKIVKFKFYMNKKILKKIIKKSISLFLVFAIIYITVEPTISTAASVTDQVIVTLTVDSGITISDGSAVTMAPNLGITSDTSIGSSSWLVKTNNYSGYTLKVHASSTPAMKDGTKTIEDYTEGTSNVPEVWSLATSATNKEFGFSAYGTDTNTSTWGSGATCGSGGTIPGTMKYQGFKDSTDVTIASKATVTPTAGITTNICFAAAQNGVYASSGTYTATVTATAVTN
jgi:hypothetical protein